MERPDFIKRRERNTLRKILRAAERQAKRSYYDVKRVIFYLKQ